MTSTAKCCFFFARLSAYVRGPFIPYMCHLCKYIHSLRGSLAYRPLNTIHLADMLYPSTAQ